MTKQTRFNIGYAIAAIFADPVHGLDREQDRGDPLQRVLAVERHWKWPPRS
jgi:hypothetical protein